MQVELSEGEILDLAGMHRDKQFEFSAKGEYLDADYHKKRADELEKLAARRSNEKLRGATDD